MVQQRTITLEHKQAWNTTLPMETSDKNNPLMLQQNGIAIQLCFYLTALLLLIKYVILALVEKVNFPIKDGVQNYWYALRAICFLMEDRGIFRNLVKKITINFAIAFGDAEN